MLDQIQDQNLKNAITHIFETYHNGGYECYLVGGAVRDILMGIIPHDYDFATNAPFEFTKSSFERTIDTGIKHGTISVLLNDFLFEITRYRTEINHDGRHCEIIFTNSIKEDLARRDFTINAMAMDRFGNVIDPFGGQQHIETKTLSFVGDANVRIKEDYLRILRWYRFLARFNFTPIRYDHLAIIAHANGLRHISVERIWSELTKILSSDHAIDILSKIELDGVNRYCKMTKSNLSLSPYHLDHNNQMCSLTDDPITRLVAFYGISSAAILKDLKASQNEISKASWLCSSFYYSNLKPTHHIAIYGISNDWAAELAALMQFDYFEISMIRSWIAPKFPVNGFDLIKLGIKPGPDYTTIINLLKTHWAENNYRTSKEELLTMVNV